MNNHKNQQGFVKIYDCVDLNNIGVIDHIFHQFLSGKLIKLEEFLQQIRLSK